MVILRRQNKINDFFMILAWASPFNGLFLGPRRTSGEMFMEIRASLVVIWILDPDRDQDHPHNLTDWSSARDTNLFIIL